MCESTVFLEANGAVTEAMKDVTRIVMRGAQAICTNIIGDQVVLDNLVLKEANLLSHGIVFRRLSD